MKKNNLKAWLYLLPAILFLGVFMVYPLIDVCFYSLEENYQSIAQTYTGVGLGNFGHVLSDPFFIQALKNTLILVAITVPVSTGISLLIALGLSSIKTLKKAFQTIYFLPYVTNTLAVGLVFMILFARTEYTDGLINALINSLGYDMVDFINGPYWAKMLVTCLYTVWIVMPFKILILTSALASVNQDYYKAATVDGAGRMQQVFHVTLPSILSTIVIMLITRIGSLLNIGYEKVLLLYNTKTYVTADVISTLSYRTGLGGGAGTGIASAAEMMNNVVGMLLVIGANTIARKAANTSLY